MNGHTLDGLGSLPELELQADEFSGFVLRRMGANLAEAQLAMKMVANTKATTTHPAKEERLGAIAKGWNDGGVVNQGIAQSKALPLQKVISFPVINKEYIAFDVHFIADPDTRYHVTARNNLVKLFSNKIELVGKLWSTGKSSYPFAFQTSPDDFLLIDKKGQILSDQGRVLGYLTPRN